MVIYWLSSDVELLHPQTNCQKYVKFTLSLSMPEKSTITLLAKVKNNQYRQKPRKMNIKIQRRRTSTHKDYSKIARAKESLTLSYSRPTQRQAPDTNQQIKTLRQT